MTEEVATPMTPGMYVGPPAVEVSRPPTTTTEQDLRTASQRRVNLIWEYSQAGIAIMVVSANVLYAFVQTLVPGAAALASASGQSGLLSNAFFLVIGFYFGRTNHGRIGDEPRAARSSDGLLDDRR